MFGRVSPKKGFLLRIFFTCLYDKLNQIKITFEKSMVHTPNFDFSFLNLSLVTFFELNFKLFKIVLQTFHLHKFLTIILMIFSNF
jgi:hypothetical protein